jgi:hypothetical protein
MRVFTTVTVRQLPQLADALNAASDRGFDKIETLYFDAGRPTVIMSGDFDAPAKKESKKKPLASEPKEELVSEVK